MEREKQRGNGRSRRHRIDLLPRGACVPSARLATPDASEEKWCGAGPPCCKRIRISFWEPLETPAMGNTEPNCVGLSRPFKALERPITTLKNGCCCASTGNMAQEPSWPT